MASNEFLEEANLFSYKALEVNESVVEKVKNYLFEAHENLKKHEQKLKDQQKFVNTLHEQQIHLMAQKEFDSRLNNSLYESLTDDSKIAFYISTNIARLGIMILTVFLAQVFVTTFRYYIKMSKFYDSRADALELMMKTEDLKKANLLPSIENISNFLSTENVDFGKIPQGSLSEANKNNHLTITS